MLRIATRSIAGPAWAPVLAALVLATAHPAWAIDGDRYFIPPETASEESGYTALAYGLNDRVYIGTAYYGGSGWLVEFDPKTSQFRKVFTIHDVTRDAGTGLDSQSKVHAKIQIDADGTVWLATKQGNEDFRFRPEYGESPTGYPGGHVISYQPATGAVIDHGILKRQEGLMGGAIDAQCRRLYLWSDPKQHFLIYDLAANKVTDKGRTGGSPRYTPIDHQGRVFGGGRPGVLWMYDPKTDELLDLAVRVEGPGEYQEPYVLALSRDGKSVFGCALSAGKYVMEFDLESIRVEEPGKETVPGTNGTIRCFHRAAVPNPGDEHAGAVGQDGCFYFASGQRVVRYDPVAKTAEDLGQITIHGDALDKRSVANGACIAPDGTLYLKYIYPYTLLKFDRLTAPRGKP